MVSELLREIFYHADTFRLWVITRSSVFKHLRASGIVGDWKSDHLIFTATILARDVGGVWGERSLNYVNKICGHGGLWNSPISLLSASGRFSVIPNKKCSQTMGALWKCGPIWQGRLSVVVSHWVRNPFMGGLRISSPFGRGLLLRGGVTKRIAYKWCSLRRQY